MKFPLPDLSTLRRWAMSLRIEDGFLEDVFTIMKTASKTLGKWEHLVCILDEMSISSKLELDVKNDQIIGLCSTAQVMMVRSTLENGNNPFFMHTTNKLTKQLLWRALLDTKRDTKLSLLQAIWAVGMLVFGTAGRFDDNTVFSSSYNKRKCVCFCGCASYA